MDNKPQWPDLDVSDECQRLAGIYVICEDALKIAAKLMTSTSYPSEKAVNQDLNALHDLLVRIKKHAYDDAEDIRVGGTD